MDDLQGMFNKQIELQKRLDVKFDQEYISIMTLAAIDELMEALRETPWKPWKKQQKFNRENFREELIDVWHFLINLSLAAGMDANDVYQRFISKNAVNVNRQKEGY